MLIRLSMNHSNSWNEKRLFDQAILQCVRLAKLLDNNQESYIISTLLCFQRKTFHYVNEKVETKKSQIILLRKQHVKQPLLHGIHL